MITLKKDDFLIILKKIIDILDRNNIIYEIPLCHLDKKEFTYQDIIISDLSNLHNITSELNCKIIKNEKGKCIIDIDNFRINLILVTDTEVKYTHHYYSWNFFPYLVASLCKGIYLTYDIKGLSYKGVIITKNIQKVYDFLGLPFKKVYGVNIPTKHELYSFIISNEFFKPDSFTIETFKEFDPNFEYNKYYYDEFILIANSSRTNTLLKEDEMLFLVYSVFPDCKIYEKLLEKDIKNKNKQ